MRKRSLYITLLCFAFGLLGCEEKLNPIASYTYTGSNKPAPAEVRFTNNSKNATNYVWEFGDGATSTETNPKHTYSTGGTFNVKLTAKNGKNIDSQSFSISILAPVPSPIANFSFTENGNFAPSKFTFTNSSTNGSTYTWDFGDGSNSTSQNPSHIFTTGGIYNVTLKVKNSAGIENIINKTVTVKNSPTKFKINSIILTSYPLTTTNGGGWDSGSGPDIFPVITHANGSISLKDYRKEDVVTSDLPYTFSSGLAFNFTSFDYQNSINYGHLNY